MNSLADKIVRLTPEGADVFVGNYDMFLEQTENEQEGGNQPEKEKKQAGSGGQTYLERKKQRSERTRARTALRRKEEEISSLEARIDELNGQLDDESLATDYEKISRLTSELAETNAQLEQAMEDWESLAETVAAFSEDD